MCLRSWRTTSVGLVIVTISLLRFAGIEVDHVITPPEILFLTGWGLIFAKDAAR
jgi:hypothetical protein